MSAPASDDLTPYEQLIDDVEAALERGDYTDRVLLERLADALTDAVGRLASISLIAADQDIYGLSKRKALKKIRKESANAANIGLCEPGK